MPGSSGWEVFFGGTFDPVHNGHIHIAHEVRRLTRYRTVLFVPNRANPLKGEGPRASGEHRRQMLQRAVSGLDWCGVSSAEIESRGPSYTVDTIDRLIEEGVLISRPGMVIGDDLVEGIPFWHDWERLFRLVTPILVRRTGGKKPGSFLPLETLVVHNEQVTVSSSEIRDRLDRGQSIRHLVPEAVYAYIEQHRPYS
jgi:nicotinate-nucleotide adenylyltransferase